MEGCYALIVFCLLAAAVAIVFSGEGVLSHAGIFGHPVFAWLGRISLPMYVSQTLFRRAVPYWFDRNSEWMQCLMIYLGILLFAMLMDGTARLCRGRRVRIPVRLYRRKIS
jgi:peptidoglycan/LPS O-acetylase OafA/YrhL